MTLGFQSTRPRGARPKRRQIVAPDFKCFNPRAREGRDLGHLEEKQVKAFVSIHAPARGATCGGHQGGDAVRVSIHAPARGATPDLTTYNEEKLFQSTRPRGARPASVAARAAIEGFNPRAREGRDHRHRTPDLYIGRFNPRAREGRDSECNTAYPDLSPVSIHAPARGATLCGAFQFAILAVSIHAPARGATSRYFCPETHFFCFNPRAREGRDDDHRKKQGELRCFNPRAREGRDTNPDSDRADERTFQSTRPRGARPGRRPTRPTQPRFNPRAREGRDC